MSEDSDNFGDPEPLIDPPACFADLIAGISARLPPEVYPPSDDTFLLLEALLEDAELLRGLSPKLCLEICVGSGAAITALAQILGDAGGLYMAADKNPDAAAFTLGTLAANGVNNSGVVRTDLLNGMRLNGNVNVLICNPPYVVTPPEEMEGYGISISWAGGAKGMEVVNRLLPTVPGVLAPGGVFYLVGIEENEPDAILASMNVEYGLDGVLLKRQQIGMEGLFVARFQKIA